MPDGLNSQSATDFTLLTQVLKGIIGHSQATAEKSDYPGKAQHF
jgi:hypothetical protein